MLHISLYITVMKMCPIHCCSGVVWSWCHSCILLISLPHPVALCAWFIAWHPSCFTPFEPVQWHYHHRLPGATGRLCGIGMQPCVGVCVCGWQAICRLFTLYISLSECCKSQCPSVTGSLLVGIHLLFSFFLFLSLMCVSYHKSNWSSFMWCLFVSVGEITPTLDILLTLKAYKSENAIDLHSGSSNAPIRVVMSETNTQSLSSRLPGDTTYIIDRSLRCHFFHHRSIHLKSSQRPERRSEIKVKKKTLLINGC